MYSICTEHTHMYAAYRPQVASDVHDVDDDDAVACSFGTRPRRARTYIICESA